MTEALDAYAKPPSFIRDIWKRYQKLSVSALSDDPELLQLDEKHARRLSFRQQEARESEHRPDEFRKFLIGEPMRPIDRLRAEPHNTLEVPGIPGLVIYPSLLPPDVQVHMLDKLLHRDLSDSRHQTNVHMHYHIPYPPQTDGDPPESFFARSSACAKFEPNDPQIHKPLSTAQFLNKKLRWLTLGGQYDWTNKVYPPTAPPEFPADVKGLVEALFPMRAEAAIVNLYSPGDTLSLHRDVSEQCDRPLASISLGCDAVFVVGLEHEGAMSEQKGVAVAVRLRSGDAVLMSGPSRYAWHGVPKVLENTCPEWIQEWPFVSNGEEGNEFTAWTGWMKNKRVNLNVRQMVE